MITSHPAASLSEAQQPQFLQISHIELFIIPALDIDAAGCRVCMRITSNQGVGWSEQFIAEHERPSDWGAWSAAVPHFIGSFQSLTPEAHAQKYPQHKNSHLLRLFADAVQYLNCLPSEQQQSKQIKDEIVLLNRSIFYLSLY